MNKRYIIGAIAAVVVIAAVLVAVTVVGGDDDGSSGIEGVEQVQTTLEGIPQDGNTLGEADAPVEIIEYGDISCPACKLASETTIIELIDEFVRDGDAKLTFRPIAFINASSERGALGAEAAGMQDAMWSFVEVLYANQGPETQDWLSDAMMEDVVTQLGLDLEKWRADYAGEAVASRFFDRSEAASKDKVDATPTFIVRGPGGERTISGAANLSEFQDAVAAVGPGER
ncbi:DsbA family protein [Miltoncostaea marina]|uniref:DsbA family protein n=1 Tax=Miltoncostaea marina TaxID=2843215 RepID=UPI001C3E183F|nr:thioredoxin domain-containing protein [Miltoncostaea marina]